MRDKIVDYEAENFHANKKMAENRFKMFFTGLIFAILSFIGINAPENLNCFAKLCLVFSMLLLFLSGLVLLLQLQLLQFNPSDSEKYSEKIKKVINFYHKDVLSSPRFVWLFFVLGMFLTILVWIVKMF